MGETPLGVSRVGGACEQDGAAVQRQAGIPKFVQEADPGISESPSTGVSELAAHQQGKPSRLLCGCPRASLNGVDMDPMQRRPMANDQSSPGGRLHREGRDVLHAGAHQALLDEACQKIPSRVQNGHVFNIPEQFMGLNSTATPLGSVGRSVRVLRAVVRQHPAAWWRTSVRRFRPASRRASGPGTRGPWGSPRL